MTDTAVNVVFNIPELLDAVLQDIRYNFPVLAACARVCRKWEIPALRLLWERCSARHLFSLLGVLQPSGPVVGTSLSAVCHTQYP